MILKFDTKAKETRERIGSTTRTKYDVYQADRQTLEQQWLKNLRQYRGQYDPDILALIPSDRSKVYPKETHTKVVGFVAKMMEMMFPASDKNWGVAPTPIPSIPVEALDTIIAQLQSEHDSAAQSQMEAAAAQAQAPPEGGAPPPPPAPVEPEPVTSEEIELAVKTFADARAQNMETEIQDQLSDLGGDNIEYAQLCKKVLRSGGIYGCGFLEGPLSRTNTERQWVQGEDGRFVGKESKLRRPFFEHVKVWNLFPDLSATSWRTQDAIFKRMVMLRHQVLLLADRDDFDTKAIKEYLKAHPTGNYTPQTHETELNVINHVNNIRVRGKYEVIRMVGYMSGQELYLAGVEDVTEDDFDKDVLADVWLLDSIPIKIDIAPFGDNPADNFHAFIYEEDEDSGLTGTGMPEVLRDSQLRLCSIDRATQDNMASTAGPVYEVNEDLIPGGKPIPSIRAFQVIMRNGEGAAANAQAVRAIFSESHITELLALRDKVQETFDRESNLPSFLFGNPQNLGEAFRTSNNMSMLTGGANMISKDTVRQFDVFTTSVIGALIRWNMEFNPKEEIKGDFNPVAKGNISLVAKEVRGAALDQFWMTLTPEERAWFKDYDVIVERTKSRDLPMSLLESKEVGEEKIARMQEAQSAAMQIEQALTGAKTEKMSADAKRSQVSAETTAAQNKAKIAEILSRVEANLASATTAREKATLEQVQAFLHNLQKDAELRLQHEHFRQQQAARSRTGSNSQGRSGGDKRREGGQRTAKDKIRAATGKAR